MPDSIADQAFYGTVSGRVFEVWVHLRPFNGRHNSTAAGLKSDLPFDVQAFVSFCAGEVNSLPVWADLQLIDQDLASRRTT